MRERISDNMENKEQPQQEFYKDIHQNLRQAALDKMKQHPELRSVMIVFDWSGFLNDSKVPAGIWVSNGEDGKVDKPESVIGTGWQMLKLLDHVLLNAAALLKMREEQLKQVSEQLVVAGRQFTEQFKSPPDLQNGPA